MHKICSLLLFCCISLGIKAQHRAVAVEINGAANGISVNLDSRLFPNSHWGYTLGLGYSSPMDQHGYFFGGWNNSSSTAFTLPLGMYYLTGKGRHHLEVGAGLVAGIHHYSSDLRIDSPHGQSYYNSSAHTKFIYYFTGNLAYRYQLPKGLLLRVGICMNRESESTYNLFSDAQPFVGLGYTF